MCHGAGKQANSYYFKGDPGLYSATAQLQSGGAPIVGCSGATYCDPATYYTKNVDVPTDAKYIRPAGSCAAVTGRPVEPLAHFTTRMVALVFDATTGWRCGTPTLRRLS